MTGTTCDLLISNKIWQQFILNTSLQNLCMETNLCVNLIAATDNSITQICHLTMYKSCPMALPKIRRFNEDNLEIIFHVSPSKHSMGTHWDRRNNAVLTSTHNICFQGKLKLCYHYTSYHYLSGLGRLEDVYLHKYLVIEKKKRRERYSFTIGLMVDLSRLSIYKSILGARWRLSLKHDGSPTRADYGTCIIFRTRIGVCTCNV